MCFCALVATMAVGEVMTESLSTGPYPATADQIHLVWQVQAFGFSAVGLTLAVIAAARTAKGILNMEQTRR